MQVLGIFQTVALARQRISCSYQRQQYHEYTEQDSHENHLFPGVDECGALDLVEHQCPYLLVLGRTNVIKPKHMVVHGKKILGPKRRTATVAGNWKDTLATVKMRIATEKRFPRSSSRSFSIDVTEALEIIPLSIRFKLVNKPPMVHSLMSIFHLNLFSLSDALGSSSIDL